MTSCAAVAHECVEGEMEESRLVLRGPPREAASPPPPLLNQSQHNEEMIQGRLNSIKLDPKKQQKKEERFEPKL